jgi:hypothetical protein
MPIGAGDYLMVLGAIREKGKKDTGGTKTKKTTVPMVFPNFLFFLLPQHTGGLT